MIDIHLDSSVSQTTTQAVLEESVLTCTKTSAPDVYANAVCTTKDAVQQHVMFAGYSILVPRGTLTLWLFKKQAGTSTWAADFTLVAAPEPAKPSNGGKA
jgi:hypothetical protein